MFADHLFDKPIELLKRIANKAQRDYQKMRYHRVASRILETRPLSRGNLNYTLLSMVHQRDVLSYLVAAKSFARYLNPVRIVVVCDPSINNEDRQTLKNHIPHIELRRADEFVNTDIPRGGCWERLYGISEYAQRDYVIQLDADTITTAPPKDVEKAILENCGFVLGESINQTLVTLNEAAAKAKPLVRPNAHIQTLSEANMASLPLPNDRLYVRGCAGFTGFPPKIEMREELLSFSRVMYRHFAEKWASWGTEQVASNYLVANANGTKVLPFPEYGTPDVTGPNDTFLHFIGSMRFINNRYRNETAKVIQELKNATP